MASLNRITLYRLNMLATDKSYESLSNIDVLVHLTKTLERLEVLSAHFLQVEDSVILFAFVRVGRV